jgi:hypothetical protein
MRARFIGDMGRQTISQSEHGRAIKRYYVDVRLVLIKQGNNWTGVYQVGEDTREASDRPFEMNGKSVSIAPDGAGKFSALEQGGVGRPPVNFGGAALSFKSHYIPFVPLSLTRVDR